MPKTALFSPTESAGIKSNCHETDSFSAGLNWNQSTMHDFSVAVVAERQRPTCAWEIPVLTDQSSPREFSVPCPWLLQ